MKRLIVRRPAIALSIAFLVICCAIVAQTQPKPQKFDPAALAGAPNVGQLVVDTDGTLHFGPRTVPLPALASPEARQAYTRQMLRRAETTAARDGMASVRSINGGTVPPAGP